jgi:hypothetical protein
MARTFLTWEVLAESLTAWLVCSSLVCTTPEAVLPAGLCYDVRWWLEGLPPECLLIGHSFGAALAVALLHLLRDRPVDPRCAVIGGLSPEGRLEPVGRVGDKVRGAFATAGTEAGGIQRVVVPPANHGEACAAAYRAGRSPDQVVWVAGTLSEACDAAAMNGA